MTAKYHFINHACFTIEKNNSTIIFDCNGRFVMKDRKVEGEKEILAKAREVFNNIIR